MAKDNAQYDFNDYKKDDLTRPRDKAWSNWAKFEKVGDKFQGFIRDAFYRPPEGMYKEQRGITLEQPDGTFVNVTLKRLGFTLAQTDNLRVGDPLTVEFVQELPPKQKGFSPTKDIQCFGKNLPENEGNPTVKELDDRDRATGGFTAPEEEEKIGSSDPF